MNEELSMKLNKRALQIEKETTEGNVEIVSNEVVFASTPMKSEEVKEKKHGDENVLEPAGSTTPSLSPCSKLQKEWFERTKNHRVARKMNPRSPNQFKMFHPIRTFQI